MYVGFRDDRVKVTGEAYNNGKKLWEVTCNCGTKQWVKDATKINIVCDCGNKISYYNVKDAICNDTHVVAFDCITSLRNIYYYTKEAHPMGEDPVTVNKFIEWAISNGYSMGKKLKLIDPLIGFQLNNCDWVAWGKEDVTIDSRTPVTKVTLGGLMDRLDSHDYRADRLEMAQLLRIGMCDEGNIWETLDWLEKQGTKNGIHNSYGVVSYIKMELLVAAKHLRNVNTAILYNLIAEGHERLKLGNVKNAVNSMIKAVDKLWEGL